MGKIMEAINSFPVKELFNHVKN
jgi:hypothetical protein